MPVSQVVRVGYMSMLERRLINSLSPDERKEALLVEARRKLKGEADSSLAFPRKEDASWNDPEFKQLVRVNDSIRVDYD